MGKAEFELEMMLPDEKKDRHRWTVFLVVNDLSSLTSHEYLTGNMKITHNHFEPSSLTS